MNNGRSIIRDPTVYRITPNVLVYITDKIWKLELVITGQGETQCTKYKKLNILKPSGYFTYRQV